MKKILIKKGDKYNYLTIVEEVYGNRNRKFLCKCICGKEKEIILNSLRTGKTKSCGCLQKEKTKNIFTEHGLSGTHFYRIYCDIIQRTINKNCKDYKNYGGRGIENEWKKFEEFKNDMYDSYLEHEKVHGTKNTTIERIDNNKNYCKENCKWATIQEQCRNKSNNNLFTHNGKTQCLSDWCKELGLNRSTVSSRIYKLNWTIEKALGLN